MPLPQITGVKLVEVPATEAKQYNDGFIASMVLEMRVDGTQPFTVFVRPYNYERGEVYPSNDSDVSLAISNIWEEAARSTTFAQVMGSICQVTSWLIRERQLLAIKEPTAEEQAELATIKEYLGVTK